MTRTADPYLREDMVRITVGDETTPWASATGGDVVGRRRYTDLVLSRLHRDSLPSRLVELADGVGQSTTVELMHIDLDGTPTGNGLLYEGTLTELRLTVWDANSCKVARDEAVVKPYSLRALDGPRDRDRTHTL